MINGEYTVTDLTKASFIVGAVGVVCVDASDYGTCARSWTLWVRSAC